VLAHLVRILGDGCHTLVYFWQGNSTAVLLIFILVLVTHVHTTVLVHLCVYTTVCMISVYSCVYTIVSLFVRIDVNH
jgi:hypothetical protein